MIHGWSIGVTRPVTRISLLLTSMSRTDTTESRPQGGCVSDPTRMRETERERSGTL